MRFQLPFQPSLELHPTTRNLLLARFLRSVGQGALIVAFALYLAALGWRASQIGLLFTASSLVGALLSLSVGVFADRWGRKPFLLTYEAMIMVVSVLMVLSANPLVIILATGGGGFGKGQSGSAGPFSPAEGAWLAEAVEPRSRGLVYSLNAGLGFFGMALGALLAGLVPLFSHWFAGPVAYRPLFLLTTLAALANFILLAATSGGQRPRRSKFGVPTSSSGPASQTTSGRAEENRALILLVLTNAFNGLAVGLTSPLIAYWFALKFGVGTGSIGPVFAITFALTGVASLATGSLTGALGIVRSVVAVRLVGLGLLVALPLVPQYGLAATVYALRSAFNRGSAGARQALAIGLVGDSRRGVATSLNAVSMQLPSTVGPTLTGYLFEAGRLALPFYLAAGLQLVYVGLYALLFRRYEPEN